jgi:hypothetical protein
MLASVMDPKVALAEARSALKTVTDRTTALVRSLHELHLSIPGSEWTVREAAVHLLTGAALFADIAAGMPSPVTNLTREALAVENAQRIADIPEAEPETLAGLVSDAVKRFLDITSGRHGDEVVVWHAGLRISVAHLVCISLGEQVLHGHDMAAAAGSPWPIHPNHARLVLNGYAPIHTGDFRLEPPHWNEPDGTDSADPAARLLVGSGRRHLLA